MGGFWTAELMEDRLPALIEPFSADRISHSSYELTMGPEAYVTNDEKSGDTAIRLGTGERVAIPPGQFAYLLTEETVKVPNDALGLISMKFGLKRRGLVNVSGFHVDPGFCGRLLFSVYNAGPQRIVISRGTPAFLLWYCGLESPTERGYDGPRLDQLSISNDDIMTLDGAVMSPQALASRVAELEKGLGTLRHIIVGVSSVVVLPIALNLTVTYWDKIWAVLQFLYPG